MLIIRNAEPNVKKVNFLFVYETKNREIESVCLICQELERRGYSVGIADWWEPARDNIHHLIEADVLITAAVYKTQSLNRILAYVKGPTKVLNMQWEQVYTIRDMENPRSPWKMEGKACQITHVSWGDVNYNKLVMSDNVPERLVKKLGQVAFDFLRPSLLGYYLNRDELFRKYNLPLDKKTCLFISSFSFVKLPENIIDPELKDMLSVAIESQREIVEWIKSLVSERKDIIFIYRPHPAEADNEELLSVEKQYKNFRVIGNESVKQWILASDVIYNWYSTSLAEIYFAGKSCFVLRPCEIPEGYECFVFSLIILVSLWNLSIVRHVIFRFH